MKQKDKLEAKDVTVNIGSFTWRNGHLPRGRNYWTFIVAGKYVCHGEHVYRDAAWLARAYAAERGVRFVELA